MSLIIFDLDFTLLKTIENIWVKSPRGIKEINGDRYKPVHPQSISTISDDESINEESFFEFYDIDTSKAKIIQPIFMYLKYFTNLENKPILILTARPQTVENKVKKILLDNSVEIENVSFVGLKNSSPSAKSEYIKKNYDISRLDEIIIFEDSVLVIEDFIQKFSMSKIKTFLIQHIQDKVKVTSYEK